jgi:hypothetical protein
MYRGTPAPGESGPAPASANACVQCSVMSVCHAAWTYAMGLRAIMSSVLFVDIMSRESRNAPVTS